VTSSGFLVHLKVIVSRYFSTWILKSYQCSASVFCEKIEQQYKRTLTIAGDARYAFVILLRPFVIKTNHILSVLLAPKKVDQNRIHQARKLCKFFFHVTRCMRFNKGLKNCRQPAYCINTRTTINSRSSSSSSSSSSRISSAPITT